MATNARSAVLGFLRSYIHAHADSPSLGQIAQHVGTTKPHVKEILERLERDRAIRRLPAAPRRKRRIVMTENQERAVATLRALGWTINAETRSADPPANSSS